MISTFQTDVHGTLKSILTLDAQIHKENIILVIRHTQYKLQPT